MWTRVPTIVDGKTISGDWTISLNERPVGRITYVNDVPGQGAWGWAMIDMPETSGRAWTEEAAMAAIKEASVSSQAA